MNDPRDKPPHSKHVNVKSKTRETQYLKYRSFKPKCVESRVAGYIKSKKSRVDNAGTVAISASTRFQQQQHHQQHHHNHHQHQPNQNLKASRAHGVAKTVSGFSVHHQVEVISNASESKKPPTKRQVQKDHRLQHSNNHNSNSKPQASSEEDGKQKSETNIQTDLRKTQTQPKSKHHQHKKHKTFDIASFPRVFSTSDLMEKMNEESNSSTSDPREKCEFRNIDLAAAPTAQPQPSPSHAEDEAAQQLEFRNEDVDIEITCHQSQVVDAPVFSHVDSMVFQCEQPMVISATLDSCAKDCRSQNCVTVPNNKPESDEKMLAQNAAHENETLEKDISKERSLIDELHESLHKLRDDLRAKGDIEQELQRSKDQLHKTQSEMNAVVDQNAKLKKDLRENAALLEELAKRNEELQALSQAALPSMTAPSDGEMVASLRSECDSLRTTNAELLNELRKYRTTIDLLEAKVGQQEKAIRMLEDVKLASVNQLGVYETEIAYLNDAKEKLSLENQQLEARNKRLLNVLALNHVLALSKQLPCTSGYGRNVIAQNFDAALNTSRKRNRLQEIKHFNTSCQKFTTTE